MCMKVEKQRGREKERKRCYLVIFLCFVAILIIITKNLYKLIILLNFYNYTCFIVIFSFLNY